MYSNSDHIAFTGMAAVIISLPLYCKGLVLADTIKDDFI